MKTIHSLSLLIGALFIFLFSACDDLGEASPDHSRKEDKELIKAIQSANDKVLIGLDEMPDAISSQLQAKTDQQFVSAVRLASSLGYEVDLRQKKGVNVAQKEQRYFNLEGRSLNSSERDDEDDDDDDEEDDDEDSEEEEYYEDDDFDMDTCFDIVYPLSLQMPDNTVLSIDNEEGWEQVWIWYIENPETEEEPQPIYPFTVIFEDGTEVSVNSDEALETILELCYEEYCEEYDEEWDDCFEIIYPISVTMPDGQTINLDSDEDWEMVEEWYEANPEVETEFQLNFPIKVEIEDEVKTIENLEQWEELEDYCWEDWDEEEWEECFEIIYPISVTMPDQQSITINSEEEWGKVEEWYEANPDSHEDFQVNFPIEVELEDGSVATVNNDDELDELFDSCD